MCDGETGSVAFPKLLHAPVADTGLPRDTSDSAMSSSLEEAICTPNGQAYTFKGNMCIYGSGSASISMSDYIQTLRTLITSGYSTADTI